MSTSFNFHFLVEIKQKIKNQQIVNDKNIGNGFKEMLNELKCQKYRF